MVNHNVSSIAVTINPTRGISSADKRHFQKWLDSFAAQYEIVLEQMDYAGNPVMPGAIDANPDTLHLHGRILLKTEMRMDNVKRSLVNYMQFELAQKKVLQHGIKYLYDSWSDYLHKGPHEVFVTHLPDESAWIYADEAQKYEKPKNRWVKHWLQEASKNGYDPHLEFAEYHLFRDYMSPILMKCMISDDLEMPSESKYNSNLKMLYLWHKAMQFSDLG